MQKLIAGTVQECENVGIETATPNEIAKMIAQWGEKYEKKHNNQF
jgi:low affinity Fe/Cu permease